MKITNFYPIKPFNNKKIQQSAKKQNIQQLPQIKNINYFPYFLGGYSLDLSKVAENLSEEKFPPDIFELTQKTLKNGNAKNKTLYDIHFEKYKGILDCYSLDELKEKYPEFKDVISVYDIETKENSFIDDFLKGKSEVFSDSEDLTLQLIKLYWGQGFSLTDLSKYMNENSTDTKDFSLHYTMSKKLNIPLMNKTYAQILKLSNKEYNKNLTEKLSIKIKEAKEAKKQRQEGEPVVIPRGHLSEAHKKHISESLKKYYKEHPEAVYKLTQRQKDFLNQNPEFKETLSEVMDFAWNNTQEGFSIKKYLSKFMKKFGGISQEELELKIEMPKEKMSALELFWIKNPWAKEKFSIATKKGWDYIKNNPVDLFYRRGNNNNQIIIHLIPKALNDKITDWAKSKGYKIKDYIYFRQVLLSKSIVFDENPEYEKLKTLIDEITTKYEKENLEESDKTATAIQFLLIDFSTDLESRQNNLPNVLKNNPENIEKIKDILNNIFKEHPIYEKIGNQNKVPIGNIELTFLSDIMITIAKEIINIQNGYEIAEYLNKKLDTMYELIETGNMGEIHKIFIG